MDHPIRYRPTVENHQFGLIVFRSATMTCLVVIRISYAAYYYRYYLTTFSTAANVYDLAVITIVLTISA